MEVGHSHADDWYPPWRPFGPHHLRADDLCFFSVSLLLTNAHAEISSFFLMWNHIVADQPAPEKESSSSSKKEEKKEEKKKEKEREEKPAEPSPWDDPLAHPSAFLTTRLNRLLPWPFPLGPASTHGPEVWWESGMPAHVYATLVPVGVIC